MREEWLTSMTGAQQKAVAHGQGPMMVLAGPGSGKTYVLTCRVAELIEYYHVNPASILVVTFTRAAADEMKARFLKLVGQDKTSVSFGTFHSIFYRIIRLAYGDRAGTLIREEQKYAFLREVIRNRQVQTDDENEFITGLLSEISLVKGEMMNLEHYYSTSCDADVFRSIYQDYDGYMGANHLIDFDDMQCMCYELFQARPDILAAWQKHFKYILIDEFQDINRLQYEIVKMLALPENNLFIVGDDDQSIYRFRGARPEIMLGFEKEYPGLEKVLLDVNFRSDANVVASSLKVIRQNKRRFAKDIQASHTAVNPVLVRRFEDTNKQYEHVVSEIIKRREQGLPVEEVAVLYRTVRCAAGMVQKLMDFNIPFQMKDTVPDMYSHFTSKAILAYLRIAAGSRDRSDFLEIINKPNRYISRTVFTSPEVSFDALAANYQNKSWMEDRIWTLELQTTSISKLVPFAAINYIRKSIGYDDYLKEYAKERRMKVEDLFDILDEVQESARDCRTIPEFFEKIRAYQEELKDQTMRRAQAGEGVVLSTMHAAKGLEYDTVFIIDANEGISPHEKAVLDEDVEEERRLFYVAMTRAKNQLIICCTKERYHKQQEMSRFIMAFIGKKKSGQGKKV